MREIGRRGGLASGQGRSAQAFAREMRRLEMMLDLRGPFKQDRADALRRVQEAMNGRMTKAVQKVGLDEHGMMAYLKRLGI
jgi:hypothetical protein